jgi:uncharacterized membrane protein YagU involved in acid resistance
MIGDLVRGAVAGAAATWVMDKVTTAMQAEQPEEVNRREAAAAPNGRSALGNLVARIEEARGVEFPEEQRTRLLTAIHFGLGMGPGALYAVLRRRVPVIGYGGGLLYGFLVWAINDEYLNTHLGLAAPPDAYPIETHWRGLAGHLVLGSMTDSVIDALGG